MNLCKSKCKQVVVVIVVVRVAGAGGVGAILILGGVFCVLRLLFLCC